MKELNVLLLDDDLCQHNIFQRYFDGIYNIHPTSSYEEAENIIKKFGHDFFVVFIIDLLLEDSIYTGMDFIEQYLNPCKVIISSGYLNREILQKLIDIGVFACFSKPYDLTNIFISMNSIIRCEKNGK